MKKTRFSSCSVLFLFQSHQDIKETDKRINELVFKKKKVYDTYLLLITNKIVSLIGHDEEEKPKQNKLL
jgi:hypothetical protein